MVLDREMGRVPSVVIRVASLAALSARSLPGIDEWPGIYWIRIDRLLCLHKYVKY